MKRLAHSLCASLASLALLLLAGCGGASAPAGSAAAGAAQPSAGQAADKWDEQALLEAAKKEPPLATLNNSGAVTRLAQAFEAKYGLKVNGAKADSIAQTEQVTREVQSGNVKLGVLSIEDGALVQEKLFTQKIADPWVPPDMVNSIPKEWQNPLVQIWDAKVVFYNPEAYSSCPVNNMWDLTDPKWRGKFAWADPLAKPETITWFSWIIGDEYAGKLASAYQQKYGSPLQTTEKNAGYEWIKRLAANQPILTKSDDDASSAIGGANQNDPPVGILSMAKVPEAPPLGLKIAPCKSVIPFLGWAYPRYAALVHGTPSPNAAKLYIHYLMTADGAAPTINDHGGFSGNTDVPPGQPELLGDLKFWQQNLVFLAPPGNTRAWEMRQPLSDFWRLNRK
jgi:iron(III) transport system substrate-binding protein